MPDIRYAIMRYEKKTKMLAKIIISFYCYQIIAEP